MYRYIFVLLILVIAYFVDKINNHKLWDITNIKKCKVTENATLNDQYVPFDIKYFNIYPLNIEQVGCFPNTVLIKTKNAKNNLDGLPIKLRGIVVEQKTSLPPTTMEEFYKTFYQKYLDWIFEFTAKGGIILLKGFEKSITDSVHKRNKEYGHVLFNTSKDVIPPKIIPLLPHSHILPQPMMIQCLEQVPEKHLGHTVFFDLTSTLRGLKNTKPKKFKELEKFISKPYHIPWVQFPHDYISCSYGDNSCNSEEITIQNTTVTNEYMVSEDEVESNLVGFGLLAHIWFYSGGGYILLMIKSAVGYVDLGASSIFIDLFLDITHKIFTWSGSDLYSIEKVLWNELWMNSLAIRLEENDVIISNSWINPHARTPYLSKATKKLKTIELFPCNMVDPETDCGQNFNTGIYKDISGTSSNYVDTVSGGIKPAMVKFFTYLFVDEDDEN